MKNTIKTKIRDFLKVTPYFWRYAYKFEVTEHTRFTTSCEYWENRYAFGGTSGSGSSGKLARFKAAKINEFVRANDVRSVIELGCGDGRQLALAEYPRYIGLDIAKSAIRLCIDKFSGDKTKTFFIYDSELLHDHTNDFRGDAALSADVIYHLVEDDAYQSYMEYLFGVADRFVIIYSSNFDEDVVVDHVRHRMFTVYVGDNFPDWELLEHKPNRYPASSYGDRNGSFAEFYVYQRCPTSR